MVAVNGYFFDAIFKIDHEKSLTITEHPVEEGASITDHSYVNPNRVSLDIGMSDVHYSLVDGQFEQGFSRSISAFDTLQQLLENRIPCTIKTKLKTYHNMLLETLVDPDDYTTQHGLRATAFFREIIVVSTSTAILPNRTSAAPHKTGETNRGAAQPHTDNRSTIRKGADALNPFGRNRGG